MIIESNYYLLYHDKPGTGGPRDRVIKRVYFSTGDLDRFLDIKTCRLTFAFIPRESVLVELLWRYMLYIDSVHTKISFGEEKYTSLLTGHFVKADEMNAVLQPHIILW